MFRTKNNRKAVKAIDNEESRRKRGDNVSELRKTQREEQMQKRRAPVEQPQTKESIVSQSMSTPTAAEIPMLAKGCYSEDLEQQLECTKRLRKLLSIENKPPIQSVIDSGVVPRLMQFLQRADQASLQFEAAWAITNIASGNSAQTKFVCDLGAIPVFVYLLNSHDRDVKEQAVWALGNIAGDSPETRDYVLRCGALGPLMNMCVQQNGVPPVVSLVRNACWALANLCRGKPEPPFEIVRPVLMALAVLVRSDDSEILTDACWALSYLSDDNSATNQKIQAVVDSGVVARVVDLLGHPNAKVQTPALRCIGNIVTGTDRQTQVVLEAGGLHRLRPLLSNPKRAIRKEACWAISNITAGSSEQIDQCIAANLLPSLIQALKADEFNVQKEATWALCNITTQAKKKQIKELVNAGFLTPICAMLECADAKIVQVALEGIESILRVGQLDDGGNKYTSILEECGGVDALENLQRHDNEKIYQKSVQILRTFFESDDADEDEALAPAAKTTEFNFGVSNAVAAPAMFNFGTAITAGPPQSPFKFQF